MGAGTGKESRRPATGRAASKAQATGEIHSCWEGKLRHGEAARHHSQGENPGVQVPAWQAPTPQAITPRVQLASDPSLRVPTSRPITTFPSIECTSPIEHAPLFLPSAPGGRGGEGRAGRERGDLSWTASPGKGGGGRRDPQPAAGKPWLQLSFCGHDRISSVIMCTLISSC